MHQLEDPCVLCLLGCPFKKLSTHTPSSQQTHAIAIRTLTRPNCFLSTQRNIGIRDDGSILTRDSVARETCSALCRRRCEAVASTCNGPPSAATATEHHTTGHATAAAAASILHTPCLSNLAMQPRSGSCYCTTSHAKALVMVHTLLHITHHCSRAHGMMRSITHPAALAPTHTTLQHPQLQAPSTTALSARNTLIQKNQLPNPLLNTHTAADHTRLRVLLQLCARIQLTPPSDLLVLLPSLLAASSQQAAKTQHSQTTSCTHYAAIATHCPAVRRAERSHCQHQTPTSSKQLPHPTDSSAAQRKELCMHQHPMCTPGSS